MNPIFLLVSIILTVSNPLSAYLFDSHVVWNNPGTISEALRSRLSQHSGSSMPLSRSISDSTSAVQSSSLSFALSKSLFQCAQFSVSEMVSGAISSSLLTGWWSIGLIRRTFHIWVRPPKRFFADKASGKGDRSDNLNAAAPSCSMSDQDAVTISSVFEIYPMSVICLFWAQDSFFVAC